MYPNFIRAMSALICLIGANLATIPGAAARTLAAPDQFSESFVGAAEARSRAFTLESVKSDAPAKAAPSRDFIAPSRLLVGLRLGKAAPTRPVILAKVQLAAPGAASGERLCVALGTQDSRYAAESAHVAPKTGGAVELGLKTAYAAQLASYREGDLLVLARQASACRSDIPGALTPAIGAGGGKTLVVALNLGQGRPRVWLEADGARKTGKVRCKRAETPAKTHECVLDVASLSAGRFELVIDARRLDGRRITERRAIVLP
ncbi:MAG: hypothetical protein MRY74_04440 [Neomegalonema sp.]|nr:hypothetical protein [Neomegalonema sp.]